MKKYLLLLLVFFSYSSFATIWITLSDPSRDKIAVAGASSGEIGDFRTMITVDNVGIAVIGSWYISKNQEKFKRIMSDQKLSAAEVAEELNRLMNQGPHKRRVSYVNSSFENASSPGRGCHENNYYCGKHVDPRFTITGGGLVSSQVITAASDVLKDPKVQRLPIECQLYKGLEAIFAAGAEYKTVQRVAFLTDDLNLQNDSKIHLFHRKGHEQSMLQQMKLKLHGMGLSCP